MKQPNEKYFKLRSEIENGDIILFRGKEIIPRLIQFFDKSYYSHVGVVFESNERLLIIDSDKKGVDPHFLSSRMAEFYDFCILKPKNWSKSEKNKAVSDILEKAEHDIKYDMGLIVQILLKRIFGSKLNWDNINKDICSEFARRFIRLLVPVKTSCFENENIHSEFITPWDYILYADENFEILYDESDKDKFRKRVEA